MDINLKLERKRKKTNIKDMNTLLYILITISFISCDANKPKVSNLNHTLQDTVIKDLPKGINGKIDEAYYLKDAEERKAGFENLEAGFDSVYIRIWCGCPFDKSQVIELKCQNEKWTAEKFNLTDIYNENSDSIITVKKESQKGTPKSGWDSFIKELYSLDILTLPTYQSIPNYNLPTDSYSINVQVATKTKYRMYIYPAASYNKENITEAKKMSQIMDLIESELDFKRLCNQ